MIEKFLQFFSFGTKNLTVKQKQKQKNLSICRSLEEKMMKLYFVKKQNQNKNIKKANLSTLHFDLIIIIIIIDYQ